jgi:hypothetical protein
MARHRPLQMSHGPPPPFVPRWNEALLEGDTMEQSAQSMSCPDCHALTDDLAAHERWHSRLVHDIAVAVDKENKRRDAAAAR